jgi:hypothetical protein
MSVLFPRFRPTERQFTPGVLPQTVAETESQRIVRKPLASKAGGALLELVFTNITDSEAQQIQATHTATLGTFGTLQLPGELFAGDPDLEAFVLEIGGLWRFLEPPTIEWAKRGRCTVRVRLLSYRDSSKVLGPAVVPPLAPETPEVDPPGQVGPPLPDGPEPDWGDPVETSSVAYFLVTSPVAETSYTTGAIDELYESNGIAPRSDGPGYVAVSFGEELSGTSHVYFTCRQTDGTKVWQTHFETTYSLKGRYRTIALPSGGYVSLFTYLQQTGVGLAPARIALLICDAQGQNQEVVTFRYDTTTELLPPFALTVAQLAAANNDITAGLIGTGQIATSADIFEGNTCDITDEPDPLKKEWIYIGGIWDIRAIDWSMTDVAASTDGSLWLAFNGTSNATRIFVLLVKLRLDPIAGWVIESQNRLKLLDTFIGLVSTLGSTTDGSGDMLACGYRRSPSDPFSTIYYSLLMRIAPNMSLVWVKSYKSNELDPFRTDELHGTTLRGIGQTADGAIVTAGYTGGRLASTGERFDACTLTAYTSEGIPRGNSQRIFLDSNNLRDAGFAYTGAWTIPTAISMAFDNTSFIVTCNTYYGMSTIYGYNCATVFAFRYEPLAQPGLNFVALGGVELIAFKDYSYFGSYYTYQYGATIKDDWLYVQGDAYFGDNDYTNFDWSFGPCIYAAPIADIANGNAQGVYGVDRKWAYPIPLSDFFYIQSTQTDSPIQVLVGTSSRVKPAPDDITSAPGVIPEKKYPRITPPSVVGAAPVVKSQITYSQSSVYPDNAAATIIGMQNDIGEETLQTATDYDNNYTPSWIKMDLGAVCLVNNIYIGADTANTLAGGWGDYYTQYSLLQYSVDDINWFPVLPGGMYKFYSPIKNLPNLNIAARYIRLWSPEDHVAVTEFYATTA